MTARKPRPERVFRFRLAVLIMAAAVLALFSPAGEPQAVGSELDDTVRSFLTAHRDQWRDENVTESDGKFLYDFVLQHKY
jgi:hypothetical protein